MINIKSVLLGSTIFVSPIMAQLPVYLNPQMPIEERVEDALSKMTIEEKVAMTHAQSKFSSAGVPRLGQPNDQSDHS